jgi:hypothetical protein
LVLLCSLALAALGPQVSQAFSPTDLSGCIYWLDADALTGTYNDGETVALWPDSSGTYADATLGGGTPIFKENILNGKPVVRLGLARHFVDMLAVLEEKTKGNLSPEEEQMLSGTIHHLRMAFVSVQNESQTKSDG